MLTFKIEPCVADGSPDVAATIWYIRDNTGFIHYRCVSPANASAVLKHVIDHDKINADLKKQRVENYYLLDGTLVVAFSGLTDAILRYPLRATPTEKPADPLDPSTTSEVDPESQPQGPSVTSVTNHKSSI